MTWLVRARTLTVLVATLSGVATLPVCAQTAAPPPQQTPAAPPESLYADAAAKEAAVRKALAAEDRLPTILKAVRTVVADYEAVVRRYPSSAYSDDALWRAAKLSRDAFDAFSEPRERSTALRLFQFLSREYPSSRLAKAAPDQVAWLTAHPARNPNTTFAATPTAPPTPPPSTTTSLAPTAAQARPVPTSAAPAPTAPVVPPPIVDAAPPAKLVTVKAIRRAVLADVVRVVVELDDEVTFHDERLENPTRVFLDLPHTTLATTLVDKTLRFDADTDIVRQVRIGHQPNNTTRIVIEASGVSSYSIYPLYSPFRLVIDSLREGGVRASTPAAPRTTSAAPAPAPTSPTSSSAPVATASAAAATTASATAAPVAASAVPAAALAASAGVAATSVAAAPPVAAPATAPALTPSTRPVAPALESRVATAPPSRNVDGGLSIARQLGLGVSRIVIDPGHGGHDPGAKGPNGTEAELVLDIALRLEKLLSKLRGVEVVLTRRGDEFIPLQERTAIANRQGADLFLSIHANASNTPAARGVETYFLNFASNQTAAAVAARENATSGQTMGALQDVVKAIALNSKLDESRDFATYVQREMLESIRRANKTVKDLGVKQAPFVVLIGAAMPSVLAEVSFITNPQEAKLLKGNAYRQRIAQALFEGVKAYQSSLKRVPSVAQQN